MIFCLQPNKAKINLFVDKQTTAYRLCIVARKDLQNFLNLCRAGLALVQKIFYIAYTRPYSNSFTPFGRVRSIRFTLHTYCNSFTSFRSRLAVW